MWRFFHLFQCMCLKLSLKFWVFYSYMQILLSQNSLICFYEPMLSQGNKLQNLPANQQNLGKRPGTDSSNNPQRKPTLLTPWSGISSLYHPQDNTFFLSKPTSCSICCGSPSKLIPHYFESIFHLFLSASFSPCNYSSTRFCGKYLLDCLPTFISSFD